MDTIFKEFREAQSQGSGTSLSRTLQPTSTRTDPSRLKAFYRSTNGWNLEQDIRSRISSHPHSAYRLNKSETKAWVGVYSAFWTFVGELLSCEDAVASVRNQDADWTKTYDAWKEVANELIKGYSKGYFYAWTIPCLYVAGKYLRLFAIKADDQTRESDGKIDFGSGYQDDMIEQPNKNEKLEDAARVINRIFTLCISDRQVQSLTYDLGQGSSC